MNENIVNMEYSQPQFYNNMEYSDVRLNKLIFEGVLKNPKETIEENIENEDGTIASKVIIEKGWLENYSNDKKFAPNTLTSGVLLEENHDIKLNDFVTVTEADNKIKKIHVGFFEESENPVSQSFSENQGNATGNYSHAESSGKASGDYSHAEGRSTTAKGEASHAEGNETGASGNYSHAEGYSTGASKEASHAEGYNTSASEIASHAEGFGSMALGLYSHAEGDSTQANGKASHAEGHNTYAIGDQSHAEGSGTFARGLYSHAEGINTTTEEKAQGSHVEGINTTAFGLSSHAEGESTVAQGNYSHAEGFKTLAENIGSHAEGEESEAKGLYSHAEGKGLAVGDYSHAESSGTSGGNYSHAEGSGVTRKEYSHAEGENTYTFGIGAHTEGISGIAKGKASHAEGYRTYADKEASHTEGVSSNLANESIFTYYENYYEPDLSGGTIPDIIVLPSNPSDLEISETITSIDDINKAWKYNSFSIAYGEGSHVEGKDSLALGKYSHAEGNNTIAKGNVSHAEGYSTQANGNWSHAEGDNAQANGIVSHAEGFKTQANGEYSHAEGWNSHADGNYSHAEGFNTIASGKYSHAEGINTVASGDQSHASGIRTEAQTSQYVIGHYNNILSPSSTSGTEGTAFIIGNGSSSLDRSNAFRVEYTGQIYANSSITTTGRDYAEYFEWQDSNKDSEDRRGYFVTLNGDKIKIAKSNDYILGIISGQPAVLGNGDEDWCGKYVLDEFGAFIIENFKYEEAIPEEVINKETGEITTIVKTVVKTGKRYKQNPDYDPSLQYIQRADRPEWDAVGMLGVLSVRDDGTCQVNGYCTVTDGGIATASETGYRVIKRVNDHIVKVIFK